MPNVQIPDDLPRLPPRSPDSHKGDFGRVLLIGGSCGMAGAIGLAGMAALRSGAGLVKLAVPAACQQAVAGYEPSYMTIALACDTSGRIAATAQEALAAATEEATSVACGPGLGRSTDLTELVAWLYQHVPRPMVLDADALNALAERTSILVTAGQPRILTPHPGEFARLNGEKVAAKDREASARAFAARHGVVLVLKGHQTIVTDGSRTTLNTTGNPGMATGGTGDVLTGTITALLAQGLEPLHAARLGVFVHGLAGDLASAELGQVGMIASDLVRFLPRAYQAVADR